MKDMRERLRGIPWDTVAGDLNERGYAIAADLLTKKECAALIGSYPADELYRKTISMERYRFGAGEYKYFRYPLPDLLQEIRQTVYPYLAPVANGWMEALKIDTRFPVHFEALQKTCHAHQQ